MDILEGLFELLPPWLATVIVASLGLIAGIGGAVLHSHEAAKVALCNSLPGRLDQATNGSSLAGCGLAAVLSPVGLFIEIGGFIMLTLFAVLFAVLAKTGHLHRLDF